MKRKLLILSGVIVAALLLALAIYLLQPKTPAEKLVKLLGKTPVRYASIQSTPGRTTLADVTIACKNADLAIKNIMLEPQTNGKNTITLNEFTYTSRELDTNYRTMLKNFKIEKIILEETNLETLLKTDFDNIVLSELGFSQARISIAHQDDGDGPEKVIVFFLNLLSENELSATLDNVIGFSRLDYLFTGEIRAEATLSLNSKKASLRLEDIKLGPSSINSITVDIADLDSLQTNLLELSKYINYREYCAKTQKGKQPEDYNEYAALRSAQKKGLRIDRITLAGFTTNSGYVEAELGQLELSNFDDTAGDILLKNIRFQAPLDRISLQIESLAAQGLNFSSARRYVSFIKWRLGHNPEEPPANSETDIYLMNYAPITLDTLELGPVNLQWQELKIRMQDFNFTPPASVAGKVLPDKTAGFNFTASGIFDAESEPVFVEAAKNGLSGSFGYHVTNDGTSLMNAAVELQVKDWFSSRLEFDISAITYANPAHKINFSAKEAKVSRLAFTFIDQGLGKLPATFRYLRYFDTAERRFKTPAQMQCHSTQAIFFDDAYMEVERLGLGSLIKVLGMSCVVDGHELPLEELLQ